MASMNEPYSKIVASTKRGRAIYLVGVMFDSITVAKLPSNRQVLGRFIHLHMNDKQTIHSSTIKTIREVFVFWENARIPTKYECDAVKKIENLNSKWLGLKKSSSRKTENQQRQETEFIDTLDDLFDVAHADALTLIKVVEDREFLLAQREKGRRGSMGPIDMTLFKKEEKRRHKTLQEESRKQKEAKNARSQTETAKLDYSSDIDDKDSEARSNSDSDFDETINAPLLPKCKRPSNIVNPDLASALDRSKISDRSATYVLAATAQSLGCNIKDIAVNRESIRRARRQQREIIAKQIHDSFDPQVPLTVHWDGKMLPALTGNESVDCLAVLVSGEGVMKLLGVPPLENGTGVKQANAVFALLNEWQVADRVKLMCFDTTASNTGSKGGACVLLEEMLNKTFLSLACRHHTHELIVAKVFDQLMGTSSGPNIKIFQRFGDSWDGIDKTSYESGMNDESIASELEPF